MASYLGSLLAIGDILRGRYLGCEGICREEVRFYWGAAGQRQEEWSRLPLGIFSEREIFFLTRGGFSGPFDAGLRDFVEGKKSWGSFRGRKPVGGEHRRGERAWKGTGAGYSGIFESAFSRRLAERERKGDGGFRGDFSRVTFLRGGNFFGDFSERLWREVFSGGDIFEELLGWIGKWSWWGDSFRKGFELGVSQKGDKNRVWSQASFHWWGGFPGMDSAHHLLHLVLDINELPSWCLNMFAMDFTWLSFEF